MNEQKNWQWLEKKLSEWTAKGILNTDQAERVLGEKPSFQDRQTLLTRILISISALLFGLGIISFFAFNWQAMPKWLKLATIFSGFAAAHFAGYQFGLRSSKRTLAEFFHLLGSLLFGAGIMLIAQIYHINEHSPNGVLLWSLGALLMAYILDSTPQMLLFGILIIIWQSMERSFDIRQIWAVFFVAASMVPMALMKKHWFIVSVVTIAVAFVTVLQLTYFSVGFIGIFLFLGVMCLGIGLLIQRTPHNSCSRPLEITGSILYFIGLIVLTFKEGVKEGLIKTWHGPVMSDIAFPVFIAITTVVIWAAFCFPFDSILTRFRNVQNKHVFLTFVGFVLAVVIWLISSVSFFSVSHSELALVGMVLFNILTLAHGIILIFTGTRTGRIGMSFLGCLLTVTVILSRFAAYSDDLLIRSISFILAGGFILWIAIQTSKVKKQK